MAQPAPTPFGGPAAWRGPEVDYRARMTHHLGAADLDEIAAALERSDGLDFPAITLRSFPLPRLASRLRALSAELLSGTGVALLRGLPADRFGEDDLARIHYALGLHLGVPLAQSWQGELLGNVMNVSDLEEAARGYHAGGRMHFHTDGTGCDIVALLCLRSAKSGGASRIVSAVALHDAMLERRPDLLAVLYRGYRLRRPDADGRLAVGELLSPGPIEVFLRHAGHFFADVDSGAMRRAVSLGGVILSAEEVEAFDLLQALAADPAFHLDMEIGVGDIQFLNNRTVLHGRTHYEDHPDLARRRHMLRLWLSVPDWPHRPTPREAECLATCRNWATLRRPWADFPSRHVAAMTAELERRRQEARLIPPRPGSSEYASIGEWAPAGAA